MNEQDLFEFEDVESRERSPHLIPWLVVGIVVVLALVASIIVLNVMRGGEEPAPEPTPTEETTAPTTPEPEPTEEPEPEPEVPESDDPDDQIDTSFVVVGDTFPMDITHWNTQVDLSTKFGTVQYSIEGERLILQTSLLDSFPESCAAMRTQWGMERVGGNEFEVVSPQQMCEENTSLYTEVLGLIRAMVESARGL